MRYLIKKKKIIYSLLLFLTLTFCFMIFNNALKNENVYTPQTIKENDLLVPNIVLLELYSNEEIALDNIVRDKNYSLINIWASWCLPCKEENKFLISLSYLENLQTIGINYKDKKKNAKSFLKNLGNPFAYNLVDMDGTSSINLGAYGVPETFLIDKNKKILLKIIGPINAGHLNEIKNIIKK